MLPSLRMCVCLFLMLPSSPATATAADQTQKLSSESLRNEQLAVSGRYDRFERLLSQMADILGHEDPERAELLRRAISKGREKAISNQLGQIADDLGQNNLGRALEQQEEALESLALLLQLLQSEDRRSELEKERERLNNLLKDVSNTLGQQRSARASTQNSTAPSSSAPNQQKAIDRAGRILDDIQAHDGDSPDVADDEPSDGEDPASASAGNEQSDGKNENSAESSPSDSGESKPGSDNEPSETEAGNDEDADDDGATDDQPDREPKVPSGSPQSSGDPSKSDSGDQPKDAEAGSDRSGDSQSQKSDSSQSGPPSSQNQSGKSQSPSQNSPPSAQGEDSDNEQTPGKEEISKARELMQEALEQLQKQLRDEALEKQDGAIDELQKAVEELRQKLLQLREEEKEMILASLEARFQRMLSMQSQIYDETVDLSATPVDQWLDTMFARSREMAQQQAELQVDSEQTLGLLKEDGTSVSIVLSVEDITIDMRTIAGRLRESKAGTLTQALETDIIEALKELIEATQREMQDMKSEEHQQQAQSGDQKKPPLVQLIAEIKILRSLQLRINRRTQRTDTLIAEQSEGDAADLLKQLEELTDRQQRLVESAEELAERMSSQ
jgi:hypothetical protein